jgi:hypothetical protein
MKISHKLAAVGLVGALAITPLAVAQAATSHAKSRPSSATAAKPVSRSNGKEAMETTAVRFKERAVATREAREGPESKSLQAREHTARREIKRSGQTTSRQSTHKGRTGRKR